MRLRHVLLIAAFAVALAACDEQRDVAEGPAPREPTRESIGHYCGMSLVEHDGPKGQIFLEGKSEPIWFSSVRDTLAFTLLPEEPKSFAAIYVNDMAKAETWTQPEAGAWVEARSAVFVVGSDARGGMGAPEAVPFSEREAAERFKAEHGGLIHAFGQIPEDFILGPGEAQNDREDAEPASTAQGKEPAHDSHKAKSND